LGGTGCAPTKKEAKGDFFSRAEDPMEGRKSNRKFREGSKPKRKRKEKFASQPESSLEKIPKTRQIWRRKKKRGPEKGD